MTRKEKLQKAHQMFDNRNLLTELNWQREYFRRGYISNKEELFNLWIFDECIKALKQEPRWIPVSERLPTKEEYIANNGLFIVSDGNRTYAEYFVYNSMKYFGEPTMNGFRVDRCATAWMPLPEAYREVVEE